jgi:beta,beta-carotene 9',10'-dioxygenase
VKIWNEERCYPGEPFFFAGLGGAALVRKDDGVLLSIVLNVDKEDSFLLVLDACTMQEMARLTLPQVASFTFYRVLAREGV